MMSFTLAVRIEINSVSCISSKQPKINDYKSDYIFWSIQCLQIVVIATRHFLFLCISKVIVFCRSLSSM